VAWGICTVLVGPFCPHLIRWMQEPLSRAGQDPQSLVRVFTLEAGVTFVFQAMLWGGTILSLPLLLIFIARFVFPGLRPIERRWVSGVLVVVGIVFVAGVAVCYQYILPLGLKALIEVNRWLGIEMGPLRLDGYTRIVLQTVLAFGLAFELPILLVILGWIGILPAKFLREKRRHAIVIIFFIAMVLTPPDVISMILMAVPMCLIYEVCILLIRARELKLWGPKRGLKRDAIDD
jgi:sec-independent protein translocase protein TatC